MRTGKRRLALGLKICLILLLLTPIVYVQAGKYRYERRVTSYLKYEMGYSPQDIALVKGGWGIKAPPFFAVVRFRDEPEVEYTYFAHDDVIQFSHSISRRGLRQGVRESDLRHVDAGDSQKY